MLTRNNFFSFFCFLISTLVFSAAAMANSFSFKIRAVVPVKCEAQVNSIQGSNLSVIRTCNTDHRLMISHAPNAQENATISYEGQTYELFPGQIITINSQPVFDKAETVNVTNGASAQNLSVRVLPL